MVETQKHSPRKTIKCDGVIILFSYFKKTSKGIKLVQLCFKLNKINVSTMRYEPRAK
jgi:hypothetical protein